MIRKFCDMCGEEEVKNTSHNTRQGIQAVEVGTVTLMKDGAVGSELARYEYCRPCRDLVIHFMDGSAKHFGEEEIEV